jgi:hypothetical protein
MLGSQAVETFSSSIQLANVKINMFYNTLNSGACSLLQIRRFGPATRVTYHPLPLPVKNFCDRLVPGASLARVLSKGETARLVGAVCFQF